MRLPWVLVIQASRLALKSSIRLVLNSMICANFIRCCFQHDVEWCFGDAAQCREPGAGDDFTQSGLARLCTERRADLLGQRTRRAEQGREAVVGGSDWVEVVA